MKLNKMLLIRVLITLFLTALIYYFTLPVINLTSMSFYGFIITIFIIFLLTGLIELIDNIKKYYSANFILDNKLIKKYGKIIAIVPIILIIITIINLVFSPLFNANTYANRIDVNEDAEFSKEISEVNFNEIPLLDKASTTKLGDRVMGEFPEYVSQYYVSDLYTQITYNEEIVRVTPLEYDGFIKYLSNSKEGIKAYIKVSSTTGESELVKLGEGMKYMPSAYLNYDLDRHVRLNYPTEITAAANFEIDDAGKPFWVIPTIKYTGVDNLEEISGVIIVDPVSGETKKYNLNEVPKWVDHVYPSNLIIEQLDNWGTYQEGYINSIFGQKGVVVTTSGYNYLSINNDIYLYTGITSVAKDEANLGFVLVNLRTKETAYYKIPGAEEYSAMDSAEGQVQEKNYSATFPLLINLDNNPTYLISLKDNAGLVKMYAFVDVKDYQKVVVTDASKGIEAASENYLNSIVSDSEESLKAKEITIKSINEVIIDGNTYYFVEDLDNKKYKVSIKVNENILPYIKSDDKLNIEYKVESEVTEIITVK